MCVEKWYTWLLVYATTGLMKQPCTSSSRLAIHNREIGNSLLSKGNSPSVDNHCKSTFGEFVQRPRLTCLKRRREPNFCKQVEEGLPFVKKTFFCPCISSLLFLPIAINCRLFIGTVTNTSKKITLNETFREKYTCE